MKLEIRRINIDSFKGVAHKEIVFDGNTKLVGQNGTGKTTVADSVFWTFTDSNTALVKNPDVVPIGAEECTPTVVIECELDGTPLKVSKVQKYKKKEVDGKVTSSVTNTYAINDIPKSYRDFVADLTERGIDMENFLVYSNPNSFLADTSKAGRDKIRKVLFKMAGEFTDLDIAKSIGAVDVVNQIEQNGLKLEEIKASSSASIKRIEAENGRSNELIDAKISGFIESKSNVSLDGIAEREMEIKMQITSIEQEIKVLQATDNTDIEIMKRESAIKAIEVKTKEEYYAKRSEHLKAHNDLIERFRDTETIINKANKSIEESKRLADQDNNLINELRAKYDTEFARQFENDGKCPYCGQDLPQEMLQRAEHIFNDEKAKKLNDIMAQGDAIGKELERLSAEIADAEETIARFKPEYDLLKAQIEDSSKWNLTEPNISEIPEVVSLQAEINELKAVSINPSVDKLKNLNQSLTSLRNELSEIEGRYKLVENDKAIDSKVAILREKKRNDEITKANLERILYQVSEVERAKNEKLSESINQHFPLIEWHLWDTRKNGEYVEITEPYIDGKPMSSCANGSLMTLAKISICDSLGRFFNQNIPIWCDDASLFSKNTTDRINIDAQFIQLVVKDGVNELTIEKGV